MTEDTNITKFIEARSPEEKLTILRAEMILPISTIRGYAKLLKDKVSSDNVDDLPDDFGEMLERIVEAGDALHEILEALTRKSA
jgi:nitrogen-specific signal transduction histidine kinase